MLTEQQILHYVSKQPKHMAGFKQLIHDLALKGKDRRALQQLLRDMTRRRKLIAIGKERWGLPTSASNQDLVVGRLRMHRDQVLVELGRLRHDGKAEGRIVRVMEREQETVVGIFHYGSGRNYVTPIDEKLAMEIIIPPGMEYPKSEDEDSMPGDEDRDTRVKRGSDHPITGSPDHPIGKAPSPKYPDRQSPHRVLGAEAQRKSWDDLENVVVEVEITQWPSATQSPRGRVTEILGYEDDFGVDVEMIIRKHYIPHVFPAEVLEEAQEINSV